LGAKQVDFSSGAKTADVPGAYAACPNLSPRLSIATLCPFRASAAFLSLSTTYLQSFSSLIKWVIFLLLFGF
jgi:hypothetical protein